MARRRKLRIVDLSSEQAAPIAEAHALVSLSEGLVLRSPCRFWERKDGSWTARFVYDEPDGRKGAVVLTSRGIVFQ